MAVAADVASERLAISPSTRGRYPTRPTGRQPDTCIGPLGCPLSPSREDSPLTECPCVLNFVGRSFEDATVLHQFAYSLFRVRVQVSANPYQTNYDLTHSDIEPRCARVAAKDS